MGGGVLSQATINNGYGIMPRVFKPMSGLVGSSGRSISNVEILETDYIGEASDGTIISVTNPMEQNGYSLRWKK